MRQISACPVGNFAQIGVIRQWGSACAMPLRPQNRAVPALPPWNTLRQGRPAAVDSRARLAKNTILPWQSRSLAVAQTQDESRMAHLIVEVLNLEDVAPDEIDPSALMFDDDGLGLDSIDALEIAVAIAEQYGVHLSAEDEATRDIFATLGSLTAHVMQEADASP